MLNKTLKKIINSAGHMTYRTHSISNPVYQLFQSLNYFKVDLVLDVGANKGQFASELRTIGFDGKIVSFEPLSEAHKSLNEKSSRDDNWFAHPRCAIGNYDGEIEINIAGNSVSSSVLSMLESHSNAAPDSAYVDHEKTPIFMLDTVASPYLKQAKNPFIKIDTQGYEWQVLNGAEIILPQVRGVLCELSLVGLYEGQYLWQEIIQRMEECGFTLWGLQKGFTEPTSGRSLQMDGIFFREN